MKAEILLGHAASQEAGSAKNKGQETRFSAPDGRKEVSPPGFFFQGLSKASFVRCDLSPQKVRCFPPESLREMCASPAFYSRTPSQKKCYCCSKNFGFVSCPRCHSLAAETTRLAPNHFLPQIFREMAASTAVLCVLLNGVSILHKSMVFLFDFLCRMMIFPILIWTSSMQENAISSQGQLFSAVLCMHVKCWEHSSQKYVIHFRFSLQNVFFY